MDGLKPETVNAYWANVWDDVFNNFKGFPSIDEVKIIETAREVGGEGFFNILDELEAQTEGH